MFFILLITIVPSLIGLIGINHAMRAPRVLVYRAARITARTTRSN